MIRMITRSVVALVTLASFIPASFAAEIWECKDGKSADGKVIVEALLTVNKNALITITYLNTYDGVPQVVNEELEFSPENNEYVITRGYCTDQVNGGEDLVFTFKGEKSNFSTYWCDDDGGSGVVSYDLTCSKK